MRFRVLGPLEVDAGDGPIPLGGPKQRAVLANLLIRANQVVPADRLIDEIWGEDPPEKARNTLQTYVSNLRRSLGDRRLQGRPPGYILNLEPFELDAIQFDTLVRDAKKALPIDPGVAVATLDDALGLWRGPALADLADRPSFVAEAARLDELRLEAQEGRVEGLLAGGDQARAVGELEAILSHHPLRESLWALLMLALYREGRQAEALNTFQRAREVLADELGIDPSPEVARLHERILRQDPGLDLEGEPLRGYRLLEQLGDGPDAAVFRAIQPRVGRDVVVKVFREGVAGNPAFVQRFEPEAGSAAGLEHPHIAFVYDYWREPGRAYVVSRYFRGGSLKDLRDRGERIERDRGLRALEQVADALAFAHRQGVVHGHVCASNVLLDGEGAAYLADFCVRASDPGEAADDVRALAQLARHLFDDRLPAQLDELVARVEANGVEAAEFAEVVRQILEPVVHPRRRPAVQRNPYKGLRPFTEADAPDFFGRGQLVAKMVSRMNEPGPEAHFLAVVGPSGAGKSSLVRAGLVPAIRRGAIEEASEPFVTDMFPGAHPLEEMEAALLRIAVRPATRLRDLLEAGSRGLIEAVDLVLPEDATVVLVIDQLEELFTLTSSERERELFLEQLRVACVDPAGRVRVIATLRADFFDPPLAYPRFGELLTARIEAVPPLDPDELEQTIRRPAELIGVRPEPGLEAAMVADIAHQPGALPLLQYALTELFERRTDDLLSLESYRATGGVAGALSTRAERIFGGGDAPWQGAVRQVFLRLVTLGEGTQDTRRRVARSELDGLHEEPGTIDEVLDVFGRHRLVTFDREPSTREPTVEIAHEALLGAWARLRGWIDEAREDLRLERRLDRASAEWEGSGRDPSFLMRGSRLDQVVAWVSTTSLAIGTPERAYVKASVGQRGEDEAEESRRHAQEARTERRSRARLRALVAVFAVAALVAGTLTIVATDQSERAGAAARNATARELAASSVANRDTDPELSILLAMEAIDTTRSVDGSVLREAEEALHQAVLASRIVITVPGVGGEIAWGSEGTFVAKDPLDPGAIQIRDDRTGRILRSFFGHPGGLSDAAFSPDGSLLATTGGEGALKMWSPSNGALLWERAGEDGASGVSFSADGSRVAAAWPQERVARIFDVADGRLVRAIDGWADETALSPHGDRIAVSMGGKGHVIDLRSGTDVYPPLEVTYGVGSIAWSPDGRYIATGGVDRLAFLWEADTGELRAPLYGGTGPIPSVTWSPDSTRVAAASDDGTVTVWEVDAIGQPGIQLTSSATPGMLDVAFSADGEQVMASDQAGEAVSIWDVGLRGTAEVVNLPAVRYYGSVEFLEDGRHLIAAGPEAPSTARSDDPRDGRIAIWDVASGRPGPAFGPLIRETYFDVSEDGSTLAVGCVSTWDLTTVARLFQDDAGVHGCVDGGYLSPNGSHVIVGDQSGLRILDRVGHEVQVLEGGAHPAAFGPDGRLIATFDGDQGVAIWDWRAARIQRTIPSDAFALEWASDGVRLAISDLHGTLTVWDTTDGTVVWTRETPFGVLDMEYGPGGALMAVAGGDGTVRLVDAATGADRLVLRGYEGLVRSVDFSPDGSMLASQGSGAVRVWAVDLDSLIDIAHGEVTRTLTDEECREFLHVDRCPG